MLETSDPTTLDQLTAAGLVAGARAAVTPATEWSLTGPGVVVDTWPLARTGKPVTRLVVDLDSGERVVPLVANVNPA